MRNARLAVAVAGGVALPALLFTTVLAGNPATAAPPAPVRLELEEARRTVRLMNDIYVTGVLVTHDMYVKDPGNPAAVSWGKQVIRQIRAKGWPDAHIFDTTGRPLNPENNPQNPFEKAAVAAFKSGKSSYEEVSAESYRYATSIRMTDESCLTCHVRAKVGDLVGGISYLAPLKPARR